jgi:DNA-binding transcriptional ArsR family regulator
MPRADLTPVWKALADPTRRRLLDLLRARPRTTGELAARVPLSRFAVMKHLGVLARARLVLVRRRGRERWNHLNAVPIRRIYERWLSPYEARGGLERAVEGREGALKATTSRASVGVVRIEQEVEIAAPPARVWDALTVEIAAWWGAPYLYASHAEGVGKREVRDLRLDARPGGLLLEDWGGGDGAVWGTVVEVRRGALLELVGTFGMAGAVHGVLDFALEGKGKATILKLSHRAIGDFADAAGLEAAFGEGWRDLIGLRLKAWVERGEKLGLGHEPG